MAASVVMPVVLIVAIAVFTTVFTDIGDDSFGYFHSPVFYDLQLRHLFTSTGRKADRGDNTGIEYNQVFTHIVTFSYSMMRASKTCCIEKFSSPR